MRAEGKEYVVKDGDVELLVQRLMSRPSFLEHQERLRNQKNINKAAYLTRLCRFWTLPEIARAATLKLSTKVSTRLSRPIK